MDIENKLVLPKRIKGKHLNGFKDYNILTNYYPVKVAANIQEIYIFKVIFNPMVPADNIKKRMELLQSGMRDIRAFIESPVISGANIYSLKPPVDKQRDINVQEFTIKIKQVKVIPTAANPKSLLMFLNNGLRNVFNKIGYTEIGKTGKFFQVKNPENIDGDLKMFSGFKANFMSLERGVYLRVDTAKKIVRNQTVLDYINEIYAQNKHKERDEKRLILKTELLGKIIMTNYGKARYLKVIDVIFESVEEIKLNGTDTTLLKFYEQKYGKKIANVKQPLIEVESRAKKEGDKCILVPEMCAMTGIPDNFDEFKRKKISQATIKDPRDKKMDIEKFISETEKVNDLNSLKDLGIQISKQLSQINAKLIPAPQLQLGNGRAVQNGKQSCFNLFGDPIFEANHSVKCGIFTTERDDVSPLLQTFKNTSRNLKVDFDCLVIKVRENDKNRIIQAYFNEIENAIRKEKINIALIVIPTFLKNSYGEIKRQCLKNMNIVSQCITDKTLRKNNLQSVATKILLQMIAKRGNILWVPKMRLSDTMIMAFDNAKGPAGNSIVCCSTVNNTFSSYYSKASKFGNAEDKFTQMVKLAMDTINYYTKKNSKSPKQIIIFHNSSTGDQISIFRSLFIQSLISKLRESSSSSVPNLSLVMVNTKTSERFFVNDQGIKNVQAGTIVANDIVSQNYDFYIVSQGSNRGSTVPNHYKVVYTNSEIEEGLLHELIFSQCFNYVNWTGSIKIPGILQYAKKCAKFSAEALDGQRVKEDLDSKLYFV